MFRFFRRKKSKEEDKVVPEAEVLQDLESLDDSADAVESGKAVVESAAAVETVDSVVESVEAELAKVESATESTSASAAPQVDDTATVATAESALGTEAHATTKADIMSEPVAPAEREVPLTVELATSPETVVHQEVFPVDETSQNTTAIEASASKSSWMQRLRQGLSRTGSSIGSLFVGVKVNEELFEELEMALLMADAGIEATESLLNKLRVRVKQQRIEDGEQIREALKELLTEHLRPLEKSFMLPLDGTSVVMIAGVNGAGKTTSIGKLAHHFQAAGASVLLAAGDTFRAAAREQLVEWGKRNNVAVISQDGGDPAAVAFDAVNAGKARKANVVMIDTAGRLPTQLHLMEELKKIKRVINKADSEAPHEVLLVVDGNTGQNVITQIKTFDAALGLSGLVVTKLDGTAKGGTLAAVAAGSQGVRPIPVYWIGVGESLHDLQPFSAAEFAHALLG